MTSTSSSRHSWITPERLALAGLLALTLVVRGGVLYAMREKLRDDPDAYREIAENLLQHGVFALGKQTPGAPRGENDVPPPTAYRPPLYPVLLSNLATSDGEHVSLGKVAGLHLLLGVGTVWLTWLVARRLQIGNCKLQIANSEPAREVGWAMPTKTEPEVAAKHWWAQPTLRGPLLAGVIVACDPILLNQSALVMTETLAAFLAVLSLWCLARFDSQRSWFNAGLAGGAMGLAVLCRPTFLPWVGVVAAGMLVVRGRIAKCKVQNAKCKFWWSDLGWRVANCAALVVVAGMVVSPWVIRNQRVFGKPIVTTTHGGYTLWLGNNESFYEWLRNDQTGLPWEVGLPALRPDGPVLTLSEELVDDNLHQRVANYTIQNDARGFARACLYRLVRLWSPLPNKLTAEESTGRRMMRYGTAVWYCGVYLLAAAGIWRLRWKLLTPPWVWGLLLCLVFMGVHTFYWSNLRMRAPLMPFVALVAAAAVWPRK